MRPLRSESEWVPIFRNDGMTVDFVRAVPYDRWDSTPDASGRPRASSPGRPALRLGLADEVRYSILPILIGDGIPFFDRVDGTSLSIWPRSNGYRNGVVELRYEVRDDSRGRAQ